MRQERLAALQQAMKDYAKEEKKRITNEVSVLTAVLQGRTGGKGIQKVGIKLVAAVASNDLSSFLKE